MNCEYGVRVVARIIIKKDGKKVEEFDVIPCTRPGTPQQVIAQSRDTFKFRSDGRTAPVVSVLCSEHAAKLREQGCEVGPLAKGAGA